MKLDEGEGVNELDAGLLEHLGVEDSLEPPVEFIDSGCGFDICEHTLRTVFDFEYEVYLTCDHEFIVVEALLRE